MHTHERVIAAGCKISGCTVHFVRAEMDEGPIVAQAAVPVLAGDTAETLAAACSKPSIAFILMRLRSSLPAPSRFEGERVVDDTNDQAQAPLFRRRSLSRFAAALIEIINGAVIMV